MTRSDKEKASEINQMTRVTHEFEKMDEKIKYLKDFPL